MDSGLALAQVITGIREQLDLALAARGSSPTTFEVGPIELELSITVSKSGQVGGKIRIHVVEAGADGTLRKESVQRLKLTLTPHDAGAIIKPDGTRDPFEVEGSALPGEV